jgi:hypothetical protein
MSPAEATTFLRAKVGPALTLRPTRHALEQLSDRGLIMGDVLHVLKFGYVYQEAQPATRGFFKYLMDGTTPNSGNRPVRIVVIPSPGDQIKLVTVMWVDER